MAATTTREARETTAIAPKVTYQEDIVRSAVLRKLLAFARILIGFTFMWPFLDKLFGFGCRAVGDLPAHRGGGLFCG